MKGAVLLLCSFASAHLRPPRQGAFGFGEEALSKALYFEQQLDHFSDDATTWPQAYFENNASWAGPDSAAPVYVYIGGEGPLSAASVTSNFIVDVLPQTGGLLLALEHRYYGCHNASSCPYSDASDPGHLDYLTTDQAPRIRRVRGVGARGARRARGRARRRDRRLVPRDAAASRATYPDVFAMKVASSAPVHGARLTLQDAVAAAYSADAEGVAGSSACAGAIGGHDAALALLADADGRAELARLFAATVPSVEWLANETNQRVLAGCGVAFPRAVEPACVRRAWLRRHADLRDHARQRERDAAERRGAGRGGARRRRGGPHDVGLRDGLGDAGRRRRRGDQLPGLPVLHGVRLLPDVRGGHRLLLRARPAGRRRAAAHRPNDFCAGRDDTNATAARIAATNAFDARRERDAHPLGERRRRPVARGLEPRVPGDEQPVIFPVRGAHHCAWTAAVADTDQQSVKDAGGDLRPARRVARGLSRF